MDAGVRATQEQLPVGQTILGQPSRVFGQERANCMYGLYKLLQASWCIGVGKDIIPVFGLYPLRLATHSQLSILRNNCTKTLIRVLLLTVMIVLPCRACGSSSFLAGSLTKRAHCADIGSLPPHSLKLPFIIGNKKACFSVQSPPAPTTIMQTLPFIMSLVWQEASGVSDFLFSPAGQSLTFTERLKKNSPAPEKVFQALTQDAVTDSNLASLGNQYRELIDNQQQLTKEKENPSSLYIAMINEELSAVVVPGQVIPELLLNPVGHWLLDAELALYLQILPEADWLDLQPELETIASVSPTSAAVGDDGDPDREPDNDPEPALFIAGEFGVQPWISGLYSQAVLQKQRLLHILRQRARQAIANGNRDLARILRNRIVVIEADLSDPENSESQVSDNLALQTLLLEGLLNNSDEVRAYATRDLAVEAPADKKRNISARGSGTNQDEPSKKQALPGSGDKPGAFPHNSGLSDENPGPEHLLHTYNNQPCPVCKAQMCKETKPGSAKDLSVRGCHILDLSSKLLKRIFEYTSLSDRCSIMRCCKYFMLVSKDEKVISSQVLVQLQGKLPDIVFPMGAAMSAALEAKVRFPLKNTSQIVKQVLAFYLELAPSVCTHKLQRKVDGIVSLTTFPDDRIVTGNLDHTVSVWSIKEGGHVLCTLTLQGHTRPVTSVATLSDCWVISGSSEGTITIWNVKCPVGQYCACTGKVHTDRITSIETLPDMWFYSGSYDETIKVWHLTEKGEAFLKRVLSVPGKVSCLKVLSDGLLFAGTLSGEIHFWETTKSNEAHPSKGWLAHDERIICIEMFPDDQLLTHSHINEIKIWNLTNHDISCVTYLHIEPVLFREVICSKVSPDGQMIVCTNLSDVEIFTFQSSGVYFVCSQKTDNPQIKGIAFLHNGRVVTGSYDGVIKVWGYPDTRYSKQP